MAYTLNFSIEPEVLEAGLIVAKDRGIERKEVFRGMETADVLEAAAGLRPDRALVFGCVATAIRARVAEAREGRGL